MNLRGVPEAAFVKRHDVGRSFCELHHVGGSEKLFEKLPLCLLQRPARMNLIQKFARRLVFRPQMKTDFKIAADNVGETCNRIGRIG